MKFECPLLTGLEWTPGVFPTRDLELLAPRPKEVEIVSVEVAAGLLDAVPADDRPLWATALYAGLQYGEL